MKQLIAALLTAFCMSASAGVVGAHIGSKHTSGSWCDFNPGVYVVSDTGWTAGTYKNSECTQSMYAGRTFQYGRVSVTLGGVTGYRRAAVLPVVYPSVKVGTVADLAFRVGYIPKIGGQGSHVFHLSVEREF